MSLLRLALRFGAWCFAREAHALSTRPAALCLSFVMIDTSFVRVAHEIIELIELVSLVELVDDADTHDNHEDVPDTVMTVDEGELTAPDGCAVILSGLTAMVMGP